MVGKMNSINGWIVRVQISTQWVGVRALVTNWKDRLFKISQIRLKLKVLKVKYSNQVNGNATEINLYLLLYSFIIHAPYPLT